MKKMKLTALFLAIIMAFSCLLPVMSLAAEADEVTQEAYTAVPYKLRTQAIDEKANKVKVWLELSPAIAEGIAAYQIDLQLENKNGESVAGRTMSLAFDSALASAKVKEAKFDETKQTMKIYVAGTSSLVQTGADASGNITNTLPIGTVTVGKTSKKSENPFKIVLSGKTGNLKTVGLDCIVNEAAKVYGTAGKEFEIPADGTVYAALDYNFTVSKTGEGTVKAYKIENGSETLLSNYTAAENTLIRLEATPASGYSLTKISVIDTETNKEVALGSDNSFILTSDMKVSVTFEKKVVNYTFTVKTTGKGSVKAYKVVNGKETLISNGSLESGTKVRLDIKPEDGYKIAKVTVRDTKTGKTTTLTGDYTLTVSSNIEITVAFEKISDGQSTDQPTDPTCSCKCHKKGIAGFFWKISNFFNKLFGKESKRVCACGREHWKKK